MLKYRFPQHLQVGDEIADIALVLDPCKHPLRVQYLWGEDSHLKVVGPQMVRPNEFLFPPHSDEQHWYLKFCASSGLASGRKVVHIAVHEMVSGGHSLTLQLALGGTVLMSVLSAVLLFLAPHRLAGLRPAVESIAAALPLASLAFAASLVSPWARFMERASGTFRERVERYRFTGVGLADHYSAILASSMVPEEIVVCKEGEQLHRVTAEGWSSWKSYRERPGVEEFESSCAGVADIRIPLWADGQARCD